MDSESVLDQFQLDYQFQLAPAVLKDYRRKVTQCLNYTEKNLTELTKKDVRNWLSHLVDRGYKPKTIGNHLGGLKTFFNYCLEEELLEMDPVKDIPFPKKEETLPRYLMGEQVSQLRRLLEGNILGRAIMEVLYATGVRISELCNIKRGDINWNERFIVIPEGKGKKERIVLFTRECAENLRTHLDQQTHDSPYVFVSHVNSPHPYTSESIESWFRTYSERLGFKVTPHMLRHTFAADLARKGMPVEGIQHLLGHESLHTTRIYAKLYDHVRKEEYDKWM